jgi:hypothetical protein
MTFIGQGKEMKRQSRENMRGREHKTMDIQGNYDDKSIKQWQ